MAETPAQRERRMRRWRHLGLNGTCRLAATQFRAAAHDCPTLTPAARATMQKVVALLEELALQLKERIE